MLYTRQIPDQIIATFLGGKDTWPNQTFKTVRYQPPQLQISKLGEALAPGLLFFTATSTDGSEETAPLIMTDTGELVWNGQQGKHGNLLVQTLDGNNVLSMWRGSGSADTAIAGHGYGKVEILDTTYTEIYTVCPELDLVTPNNTKYDCYADLHESYITERGSILVTAYNITTADLRSVGGPRNGWVYDPMFYEIDIKTNETLFHWSPTASGIPINATHQPLDGTGSSQSDPFDWFHTNSVQSIGTGYLVNSRHLWTTFLLNSTGGIKWNISGDTGGSFTLPKQNIFSWQHHPRAQNITSTSLELHYFNNANAGPPFNGTSPTTGLELSLDLTNFTVTVIRNLSDPNDALYADTQGSFTPLSNGNVFMGYGQIPKFKEFGPDGDSDVRMTVTFGDTKTQSYRAYRESWNATPSAAPDVYAENATAYMSWNGATDVTSWTVYTGTDGADLATAGSVDRSGFETSFGIAANATRVKVAAYAGDVFLLTNPKSTFLLSTSPSTTNTYSNMCFGYYRVYAGCHHIFDQVITCECYDGYDEHTGLCNTGDLYEEDPPLELDPAEIECPLCGGDQGQDGLRMLLDDTELSDDEEENREKGEDEEEGAYASGEPNTVAQAQAFQQAQALAHQPAQGEPDQDMLAPEEDYGEAEEEVEEEDDYTHIENVVFAQAQAIQQAYNTNQFEVEVHQLAYEPTAEVEAIEQEILARQERRRVFLANSNYHMSRGRQIQNAERRFVRQVVRDIRRQMRPRGR
ncbi:MAG: hypothetical protein M1819_002019 [Sarea resinae]|nr:MAG: hypothetical protein M1819_002019 [Sarea resinae]